MTRFRLFRFLPQKILMKHGTFVRFIMLSVFLVAFAQGCSRNPLGEDLGQKIINLGFRLLHTCAVSFNQDIPFTCTIQTDDSTLTDLVWSLRPTSTCSWVTINSTTGIITGTPTDNNVGICTAVVGAQNTERRALDLVVRITVQNVAPVFTPIANPAAILEDSGLTVIRSDADVQNSEEGLGTYGFDHAGTTAPRCFDNSTTLIIDANTGAISFQPAPDYFGTCYIRAAFNDGNNQPNSIATAEFSITVTGVNDAPTLAAIADQSTFEGSAIPVTLNVNDVDDAISCSALNLSAVSSNTTVVNAGSFTWGGTVPNCVLNINPIPFQNGLTTISVTVTDGFLSASQSFDLNVIPVPDPPVISAIANQTTNEDTSVTVNFTISDIDSVLDCTTSMSATSSNSVLLPVANIVFGGVAPNCSATMTPAADQSGVSNVVFIVTDGTTPVSSPFALTVAPVNDVPVIAPIANQTITEDGTSTVNFSISDVDNTLDCTASMSATSSNGSLLPVSSIVFGGTAPNCTATLTPLADQNGLTNLIFTVSDGTLTSTSTFSLTVTPVNDAPVLSVIADQSSSEDIAITVNFTLTDVDDVLTCGGAVSAASSDTTLLPIANITFGGAAPNCTATLTPAPDQTGVANVTLTATDGTLTATSAFSYTVIGVNDAPVISVIGNQTTPEDTATAAIPFSITDVDSTLLCTSANVSVTSSDTSLLPLANIIIGGTAPNCTLTMTPAADQNGITNIVVTVLDNGAPNLQDTTSFSLTVTPVNDAPVISAVPAQTTMEATPLTVNFTISDIDSTVSCVADITATSSDSTLLPVANISFAGTAPNCTATLNPTTNNFGLTNLTFTISDGSLTATNNFDLTVIAYDDPPTISAIADQTTNEDTGILVNYTINDVDSTLNCNGSMSITSSDETLLPVANVIFLGTAPNCTVSLNPALDQNGITNLVLTVNDGNSPATTSFNLTVTPVNDSPTISAISDVTIPEDTATTAIAFTISDVDNTLNCSTSLSVTSSNTVVLPVANIVFGGTAPNCTVTMTPPADLNGVSNVAITVTDGMSTATASMTLTVTAVNDPPVISSITNQTTIEDTPVTGITFTITDVDNTLSCATSMSASSSNTTVLPVSNITFGGTAPNCTVTLTPANDESGVSSIVLTVTDGAATSSSSFTLTVTAVNDQPIISAIGNQTTNEDTATAAIAFTINDVDNILNCATSVSATSSNTTVIPVTNIVFGGTAPNCTVTMTPAADQFGASNIVLTVTDGLLTATSSFSLTVSAVNDAPVISSIANQTTLEGNPVTVNFTITDVDNTLDCATSVTATSSDTGLLPITSIAFGGTAPNCTATLSPAANQYGVTNLVFTATDGLLSNASTFSLTVTAYDDPPTISALPSQSINEDTTLALPFTIDDIDTTLDCSSSMSATSSNTILLPIANIVFSGAAPNCTVTITPVADQNGTTNVVLIVNDGITAVNSPFTLSVLATNDAPVISAVPDQTISEDGTTGPLTFTITDVDNTLDCSTSMSATSSNTTLLPVANIVFGGTAPNCTVTMTPGADQYGLSNVVLTVTDTSLTASSNVSLTVTPVNDAPVISAIANQTIAEDATTGAISFTITDIDDVLLCTSANLSVTSSNAAVLPTSNIVFAGTAPNCTVTLTPVADQSGVSNVVITVMDNGAPNLQDMSVFSLTVNEVNDTPVISAIANLTTNEDTATGAIAFTITDVDHTLNCSTSMSATSSNLTVLPLSNIVFGGMAPNCTVTMTPAANENGVSNIVLTVTDGGGAFSTTSYSLTITAVNDIPVISAIGNQSTFENSPVVVNFTIADVDDTLTCTADVSATSSDTTLLPVGNIVFGGTAPNCTATLSPAATQNGASNIVFTVTDGLAATATSGFSLTVIPVNDAPVISPIADQTMNEDNSLIVNFTVTDVDDTLDCVTSLSTTSSNGTLLPVANVVFGGTAPNCTATISPAIDQYGTSDLVFSVTDGFTAVTEAFQLTVNPVNDQPVISGIANQTTNEDTATGVISFTITDVDSLLLCTSANLSATSSDTTLLPVANIVFGGTAPNCTVTMTPAADQNGLSNIILTVTDGALNATSAFSLTVSPIDDPPVISPITNQTTNEDTATGAIGFTITDIDSSLNCSTSMSATSSNTALLPVASIVFGGTAPNCTVTMTPSLNQNGVSNIVLSVADATTTITTGFSLTVNAVDDAPEISAIADITTNEDTSTGPINFTITDVDNILNCTASMSATSSDTTLLPVANITFGGTAPNCTVTMLPALNQAGVSNIVLSVTDGTNTSVSSYSLTVTAQNDPPAISTIGNQTTNEDTATAAIAFTITDVDDTLNCSTSMSASSSDTALLPVANIVFGGTAPNCTVTMTPAANQYGSSNIVLTVTDGSLTATSPYSLTVISINDDPVISTIGNQTTDEDTATAAIAFTITDVDDTLNCSTSMSASSSDTTLLPVANIVFGGTAPNCTVTMTPALNQNGLSNVVLTVSDGIASATTAFSITVTPVNDAPVISAISNLTTSEDTATGAISFTITDVDNTLNCASSVSATTSNSTLLPVANIIYGGTAPNCTVTMTPALNENGVSNITLTVTDGVLTASSSYSLTVTAVDDAPVISSIANQITNEDTITPAIGFTITDVDSTLNCSASMTVTSSNTDLLPVANITFGGTAPNCTVTMNPALNQNGTTNLVLTVTDGVSNINSGFTLTVTPVNDDPVISVIANQTTNEDTPTAAIGFTITDVDNTLSCATSVTATSTNTGLLPTANIVFGGTAPNCTVTMTPAADQNGSSNITLTVTDGSATATSSFSLSVTAVDDIPVISAITNQTVDEDTATSAIAFTITDVDSALNCSTSMSATSSVTSLLPVANIVFGGIAPNCTVTMTPVADGFGATNIVLTVSDGNSTATSGFSLTVNPINDAPVISAIPDQTISEDTSSSAIGFTITDVDDTLNCSTSVTATSSDTVVLPVANITFGGTAPNCTVTLVPAPNRNGVSNVVLTVTDGSAATNTSAFSLTATAVNDAPTISSIVDQTTSEDLDFTVSFTVEDVDSPILCTSSNLSVTSDDTTLIPIANVVFGGTYPDCTATITPGPSANGTTNLTITVQDNEVPSLMATSSFSVTVTPENDQPTMSALPDPTILEDADAVINFTINDVDSVLNCITSMSATSSNTTLVPVANIVFSGTAPNCTATITPSAGASGFTDIMFTVNDGDGQFANRLFTLTVTDVNDLPVISVISAQTTNEDTATSAIAFTISDEETAVTCTTSVTMTSTNTALIPVANVVFGGSAPNCTAVITPAPDANGTSNISFVVSDGMQTASSGFTLTVTPVPDSPVISTIANQTTNEDTATSAITFTITDVDSALNCSTSMSASSSDTTLLPVANIVFGGTAPNCTVTMTPDANQNGVSNIVLTVTDGALTATTSFSLTVNAVNDTPTISAITNQTTNEDIATSAIGFTIADVESTLSCSTSVTATSSNATLIPTANIIFGGTAPNCTVTLTPAADQNGTSNIVLTVTDGVASNTSAFILTVTAVNDAPVLSAIANQSLRTDDSVTLNYTLTDVDNTMNCSTSVTATSGTATIITNANITKGGIAPNCTLTITPSLNAAGSSTITVVGSDGTNNPSITFSVTTIRVNSVAVSPTPFSLVNTGNTLQLAATATYSDASTADVTANANASWTSSATGTATVNDAASKGLVTAAAGSGNVNITVTHKGQTAVAAGTVYQMTGITVSQSVFTGGIGAVQAVTSQAVLTPTGTSDITNVTTWTTSNSTVATVSAGMITLNAVGTATITATYAGYSQTVSVTVQNKTLTTIAVTPGTHSMGVTATRPFIATATYSDASTQDMTASATWTTSNAGVATVSNTAPNIGRATGIATGSVTITATIGSVSGSATLTITSATLTSITVSPDDSIVTSNGTFQFTATGNYSDATSANITDQVTWTSSNTAAATISNTAGTRGIVTTPTFTGYRSTVITATLGSISDTTPLGVNGSTVSSILVTPTVTITPGTTYSLKAWANLSDGGTIDVTEFAVWTSATTAAATVSNGVGTKGVVTGVANGTSVVSAVYGGATGNRTVTVAGAASVTEMGTGLLGSYHIWTGGSPPGSPFLPANKRGERIDARINFAWGTGNSPMGVGEDFAVRWTGFYKAVATTNYFCTYTDDGVRVYINGSLVINNWTAHAPTWNCSTNIALTVGTKYSIVVEYFEDSGGSQMHLTRSSTSAADGQNIGTRIVPQDDLYPP